jgi:hypothetical protein
VKLPIGRGILSFLEGERPDQKTKKKNIVRPFSAGLSFGSRRRASSATSASAGSATTKWSVANPIVV